MRIKITAGGIYDGKGVEIPVGTELDVKVEPTAWAGRYETISGDGAGKTPVINATPPEGPFEAKDSGGGWWAIHDGKGEKVGKGLRAEAAATFNGLSDEDKAKAVAAHLEA